MCALSKGIHSWAPSVMKATPNPFVTQVFPLALQNEEVFAALIAFSTAYAQAFRSPGATPSKVVLQYQGKAIQTVRTKTLDGVEIPEYASLLTTIHLMGTDVCEKRNSLDYLQVDTDFAEVNSSWREVLSFSHEIIETDGYSY
jgi:hypothetical protein